jgi:hypothetical protein
MAARREWYEMRVGRPRARMASWKSEVRAVVTLAPVAPVAAGLRESNQVALTLP